MHHAHAVQCFSYDLWLHYFCCTGGASMLESLPPPCYQDSTRTIVCYSMALHPMLPCSATIAWIADLETVPSHVIL